VSRYPRISVCICDFSGQTSAPQSRYLPARVQLKFMGTIATWWDNSSCLIISLASKSRHDSFLAITVCNDLLCYDAISNQWLNEFWELTWGFKFEKIWKHMLCCIMSSFLFAYLWTMPGTRADRLGATAKASAPEASAKSTAAHCMFCGRERRRRGRMQVERGRMTYVCCSYLIWNRDCVSVLLFARRSARHTLGCFLTNIKIAD